MPHCYLNKGRPPKTSLHRAGIWLPSSPGTATPMIGTSSPEGQKDPLEKEISTHSSIFAIEIPWTEEPGRLQSMGLQIQRLNRSRKGRGSRDQIANIRWIIEKARKFQKNIYFCFIDYAKTFDCVDNNKFWKTLRDANTRPPDLPLEKSVCRSESNS